MALEGTIKEFGLADIFQLIGLQKKTGILALNREDEAVNIFFEDGMVVKAEESAGSPRYLTGRIFVNRGKITEAELTDALEIQKNTRQKIGGVLIAQGHITKDDLREVLAFQMKQVIYRVFRWTGGDYNFSQVKVDYDRDTIIPLGSEHILMDGVRMMDEWPIIKKQFPSYDLVLKKADRLPGQLDFEEKKDIFTGPGEEEEDDELGIEAAALLGLVDANRSINDILDLSRLGEFDTCRALLDLLDGGYIEKTGQQRQVEALAEAAAPKIKRAAPVRSYDRTVFFFVALALALVYMQLGGLKGAVSEPGSRFEALKVPLTMMRLEKVQANSVLYYFDNDVYPGSTIDLERNGYIDEQDALDTWGGPLFIGQKSDGLVTMTSAGPDRVLNSGDDLHASRR